MPRKIENVRLISSEEISCVYFVLDVVQRRVVAVGDDASAHFLEFLQVVDHFAAEEGAAGFQGWFIDNDGSAFSLDTFHDALDG